MLYLQEQALLATLNNKRPLGGYPAYWAVNTGPFDLLPADFWMGNEDRAFPGDAAAWSFSFAAGVHSSRESKENLKMAWLVHDGDIGQPIPEPASLPLSLLGLAVLAAAGRKASRRSST